MVKKYGFGREITKKEWNSVLNIVSIVTNGVRSLIVKIKSDWNGKKNRGDGKNMDLEWTLWWRRIKKI